MTRNECYLDEREDPIKKGRKRPTSKLAVIDSLSGTLVFRKNGAWEFKVENNDRFLSRGRLNAEKECE